MRNPASPAEKVKILGKDDNADVDEDMVKKLKKKSAKPRVSGIKRGCSSAEVLVKASFTTVLLYALKLGPRTGNFQAKYLTATSTWLDPQCLDHSQAWKIVRGNFLMSVRASCRKSVFVVSYQKEYIQVIQTAMLQCAPIDASRFHEFISQMS